MPGLLRFCVISHDGDLENWQIECVQHTLDTRLTHLCCLAVQTLSSREHSLQRLTRSEIPIFEMSSEGAARKLAQFNPDFTLAFQGVEIGSLDIAAAGRYGLWSFEGIPDPRFRIYGDCFWKIHDGCPSTTTSLVRHTTVEQCTLRWARTLVLPYSYSKTADCVKKLAVHWAAQACIDIENGLFSEPARAPSIAESRRATALNRVWVDTRCWWAALKRTIEKIYVTKWNIAVSHSPLHEFVSNPKNVTFLSLFDQPTLFAADPFGKFDAGKLHILYEEYDYRVERGVLSYVTIDEGEVTAKGCAIQEPYHLSYPYLVEHGGYTYCVPESGHEHCVKIYRATEFPAQWELAGTLLEGISVTDPTVFFYNGIWWMLCCDYNSNSETLLIYHADDLFGPWHPHANNPVKHDVHSARPAGAPFFLDGHLFRPAQDCAPEYGARVAINRILELSTIQFREETAHFIAPPPNTGFASGIHTLSSAGSFTLTDGKRKIIPWSLLYRRAKRKFQQAISRGVKNENQSDHEARH